MKPVIGLVANDIHHGLCFQRGHLVMRHLRDKYDFKLLSQMDMEKCTPLYLDLMVFFHPYTKDNVLSIKRARGQYQVPVVVDVDDYLSALSVDHPEYAVFKGNNAEECIMFADHLVTSTTYLEKVYGHLNKKVTVIENSIEPKRYEGIKDAVKPYHSGFVVGWTGGQSHRPDLFNTGYIEGLSRAMDENDNIRAYFHVLCPQFLVERFGARVIFNERPVDFLDYPSLCATYPMDICCVPLQESQFNDAKSDLRLLDMAPFQIPILASPRDQFVRHENTGRLLLVKEDTAQGWYEAIVLAYQSQHYRQVVAEKAQEYVMNHRTAHQAAQKWDEVFASLLSQNNLSSAHQQRPTLDVRAKISA